MRGTHERSAGPVTSPATSTSGRTELPAPNEKRAAVRAMFDRIAPRYDRLNRLLTVGLDWRWREAALAAVAVGPQDLLVDVACGTGDFLAIARKRGARAIGVDFARRMLLHASARKLGALVQGDAAALPLRDGCASVVSCGFALRNFVSVEPVFQELARVLVAGGRLVLLEVDRPQRAWLRAAHTFYFDHCVPRIGAWLSDREAYRYLPQSTVYLPPTEQLFEQLREVGFVQLERYVHGGGAAQRIIARRAGAE